MTEDGADPLGLDPEEIRRLGYWVVDAVVEHVTARRVEPVIREGSPAELAAILGGPIPEHPGDPLAALETLRDTVLALMQHGDHPRYFARVPGPASFAGVLGDWLGIGFNAMNASWAGGSGPSAAELVVLDWLREIVDMPEGTEGVLQSGGSLANLTGLAVARRARGDGVAYLSDQTHASILRGLLALGFPHERIRVLASDADFRLCPEAVADAVAADRRMGRAPGFILATAGTTNTGAVDPLSELADLCAAEDLWLHVDGAYGAPAALCEGGRAALGAIGRADSLVLDPHKWLFQPYGLGCLLVRRPGVLAGAFAMTPEYLADVTAPRGEVDFRDRSLELSRRARALGLWLTFRTHGAARIRAAIARGLALAEHAQRVIEADPRLELVTAAQLAIVTFVPRDADPDAATRRAAALTRSGYAAVSTTVLRERTVLRLCTINPGTTEAEIEETVARLASG